MASPGTRQPRESDDLGFWRMSAPSSLEVIAACLSHTLGPKSREAGRYGRVAHPSSYFIAWVFMEECLLYGLCTSAREKLIVLGKAVPGPPRRGLGLTPRPCLVSSASNQAKARHGFSSGEVSKDGTQRRRSHNSPDRSKYFTSSPGKENQGWTIRHGIYFYAQWIM